MEEKKPKDYSIFTKQEMIAFFRQYDGYCWHIHDPFDIMIQAKMRTIMLQTETLDYEFEDLITDAKKPGAKMKILVQMEENQKQRNKLDKEYVRLSKLRFGE